MIKLNRQTIIMVLVLSSSMSALFSMSDRIKIGSNKKREAESYDKEILSFDLANMYGNQDDATFLISFRKNIFEENVLEERMNLLHDGLSHLKEKYVQRIDTTNDDFRISITKEPDVQAIKKTVFFVSHYIVRGLLIKPINAYPNPWYARTFYHFLVPIKRHPYISDKDKKDIFSQIHPKVKKLKLSEYHGKITIEKLLANKKKKRRFCC